MLTSVQFHLKSILNGLQSAQLAPLQAVIQPPVLSDVGDHPFAFIWAGRGVEKRQTAPRAIRQPSGAINPGGYQKMTWQMTVRLYAVMHPDDPNLESAFPNLIDMVTLQVNVTQIPVIITDPVTGQESQILTIGENVDVDYASVRTAGDEGQAIIRFACDLTVEVQEKVAWTEGVA
jgi:hypothetical protein